MAWDKGRRLNSHETLDHSILLHKLKMYGFSDHSLAWIKSYLTNRKHTVYCNHVTSKETTVSYGVPQGSILGPSLFIIYVNDLLYTLLDGPNIHMEMYADDTVLYASDTCPDSAIRTNESAMNKLHSWCIRNKLTINFKKTKHMMIYRTVNQIKEGTTAAMHIGDKCLDNVSSYHYLGIDLDNGLTYDKMLDDMHNKANRKLYMLKRIRPYITNTIANLVYKTHVLPMLDYADFIVDSGRADKIERLNSLQKRAVKLIDNKLNRGLDSAQLMDFYDIQRLSKRRKDHHLSLMYRLKDNKELLEPYRAEVGLRSKTKIKFRNRTTTLLKLQIALTTEVSVYGINCLKRHRKQRQR